MAELRTYETDLAGVAFRPADVKELIASLTVGDELIVARDVNNAFDDNAIKIMQGPEFLGFVQKVVAQYLAPILDSGQIYKAVVKVPGYHKVPPLLSLVPTGEVGPRFERDE